MFQERDRQDNILSCDVQALIPRTCEHARLHDKDEPKMHLKLILKWGYIPYYPSGPIEVEVKTGKENFRNMAA